MPWRHSKMRYLMGWHDVSLHYTALHDNAPDRNTTRRIMLHYTTCPYNKCHHLIFQFMWVRRATLHCITICCNMCHYNALQWITIRCYNMWYHFAQHYTGWCYNILATLHYTTLHCETSNTHEVATPDNQLRYIALYVITLHYPKLTELASQCSSVAYCALQDNTIHYFSHSAT